MLVWKGWGLLSLVIPLVCALSMEFAVDYNFGNGFYKTASWPLPLAFLISSIPVFIIGFKLNSKIGRILIDPENNEKIELKVIHSFFWIPMQYWSVIMVGVSVWMYLSNIGVLYSQ